MKEKIPRWGSPKSLPLAFYSMHQPQHAPNGACEKRRDPWVVKEWRWAQENPASQLLRVCGVGITHWNFFLSKVTLWGCRASNLLLEITAPWIACPIFAPPSISQSLQVTSCPDTLKIKASSPPPRPYVIQRCSLRLSLLPDSVPALLAFVLCLKHVRKFPPYSFCTYCSLCLECSSPRSTHG